MAETLFDIHVGMRTTTCYKGHFYAIPHWMTTERHRCPMCADEAIRELEQDRKEVQQGTEHLRRVIRSLRGALNRKKARR